MLKREFKNNFKSFMIWTSIIVFMFIAVFLIYPSFTADNMLDQFINMMPENMMSIFNMDVISINKVSGWLATEGYMMITLLGSCYVAMLASNLLTKEEDDKTINFLYAKPISRERIYLNKVFVGFIYILLFNLLISITTFIGLNLSNDFNFVKWLLLSLLPILLHLFIYLLSIFISLHFDKTRKSMSVCLGITFFLYLINVLALLSDKLRFLKYISPFTYIDSKSIILDNTINLHYISVITVLSIICLVYSFTFYRKKEFL